MARFRRKYYFVLIALLLLVLTVSVILKALSLEDIEAMDLFPVRNNAVEQIKMVAPTMSNKNAKVQAQLEIYPPPNYYVQIGRAHV